MPYTLKGRDIIGLAETGSGKTAAFAIPVIQKLLDNPQPFFACVMSPTRELCVQIAEQFDVHPNQVTAWKAQLEGGAADVFDGGSSTAPAVPAVDVKQLHAKIGELTLENDFLESALTKAGLLSARR